MDKRRGCRREPDLGLAGNQQDVIGSGGIRLNFIGCFS